jgi:hypothetical protein
MFAGAPFDDQVQFVSERAVGVLGKLAIVTGSLMGQADSPEKVEKFWLLDVDQSGIPRNSRESFYLVSSLHVHTHHPELDPLL